MQVAVCTIMMPGLLSRQKPANASFAEKQDMVVTIRVPSWAFFEEEDLLLIIIDFCDFDTYCLPGGLLQRKSSCPCLELAFFSRRIYYSYYY